MRTLPILLIALLLKVEGSSPSLHASESGPLHVCTEMHLPSRTVPGAMEAWSDKYKLWPQNSTLRVKFLSGSKGQRAEAWERFAAIEALVNLRFVQVTSGASELRVRFDYDKGHWSYVGRDCLGIPRTQPTMNLALKSGWFGDKADEWDRVALHEILHAIGLYHEHQHPQATIPWNVPKVIAYYEQTQGWSEAEIRQQVLNREPMRPSFLGTSFDPMSIMEYPVPAELTTNGFSVGWNRQLSALDVQFLARLYPRG